MADEITLTLEDPYIGSAYSPQVTVESIEGGHSVTITSDVPGEGIVPTMFDVMDGDASQAIEDAEAAAAAARAAASSASSAATSATSAAGAASTAAGQASTAAGAATDAASAATGAAASATAAAADATEAAGLADDATTAATAAAGTAGTATREAIAATTGANAAAASANAAAGSATDAASSANTAAGAATDAAASATSAASAAGTAATAANTAADAATEAAEGITDAWLPRVVVGASDGITGGGPLDTASWVERSCPGSDGPARIESIHGRTLVWNQLVSSYSQTTTGGRGLTAGESYIKTGHVYYVSAMTGSDAVVSGNYIQIALYTRQSSTNRAIVTLRFTESGEHKVAALYTSQYDAVSDGSASNNEGNLWMYRNYTADTSGTTTNLMLIDLTRMFGAGNEPSTVAEFEALFPDAYYPYDAGSLQPVRMTGVESVGDGWTFQRAIDAGVLRGAGSAYDELTADEHVVRVGEVDLGSLTWLYETNNQRFASSVIQDAVSTMSRTEVVCSKYDYASSGSTDKTVFLYNHFIYVYDSDYTDAATFKAAMDSVMLDYPLATPTVTPIDPALNLTYKAAAGGTERILHTETTAPPTMVVQYGSTADGIRDRALEAIAAHDGPVAQTYHAVGSYLTLDGTLYRVTTAIAAGERIASGTNVVATTVMAEVIALAQ